MFVVCFLAALQPPFWHYSRDLDEFNILRVKKVRIATHFYICFGCSATVIWHYSRDLDAEEPFGMTFYQRPNGVFSDET